MSLTKAPRNRREARAWVRAHWQEYMRTTDCCDLPLGWSADEAGRVFEVFCEESTRLADKLEPRRR